MTAFVLCALVLMQQPAAPQAPAASAPATAQGDAQGPAIVVEDLPISLDRIQRALAAPAPIELKEAHPVFRLEIFGRQQTIEDLLGERFWIGPVPYGGMTHQDFLNMVTPQLAQSYAGFSGKYLVAQTALTIAEMWAFNGVKTAIKKFKEAQKENEREAARKEVVDALAALDRARRAAGIVEK